MGYGNPLATLRTEMRKLRQQANAEDYYLGESNDDSYPNYRKDLCTYCKNRLADGLHDLRQMLFDRLPSFFGLKQTNPEEEQDDNDE